MLRTSSGSRYWAKERSDAKYGTGIIDCEHHSSMCENQDCQGMFQNYANMAQEIQSSLHKQGQHMHKNIKWKARGCRLTLTNESGDTGLRCPAAASEGAFLTSGAGWRWSREKTCTVPLSDDRASHCGLSPLLNAMLYMQAGSAPLRSSCMSGNHCLGTSELSTLSISLHRR